MTVCHTMKTKQQYKGAKYWYTPQHRQISKIITLSERKLRQYILYFIVYIKLLENVNYRDRKLISVGGAEETSGGVRLFIILIIIISWSHTFCQVSNYTLYMQVCST